MSSSDLDMTVFELNHNALWLRRSIEVLIDENREKMRQKEQMLILTILPKCTKLVAFLCRVALPPTASVDLPCRSPRLEEVEKLPS